MTKVIRVVTLVLALSVHAQAGIMQTGAAEEPPPPPPPATSTPGDEIQTETPAEGIMQTGLTDAVSQATLGVLQSLLSLF